MASWNTLNIIELEALHPACALIITATVSLTNSTRSAATAFIGVNRHVRQVRGSERVQL